MIANVAFFLLMFLGVITGLGRLGFEQLDSILMTIFAMTGQIDFGLVILCFWQSPC
jgi:hypothetical protein